MAEVKITINEVPKKKHSRHLYLRLFFHFLFNAMFLVNFIVFLCLAGELIINGKLKHPESLAMLKFGPAFGTNWNLVSVCLS